MEVLDTKVLLVEFLVAAYSAELCPYGNLLSPLGFGLSRNGVSEGMTSILSLSRMALLFSVAEGHSYPKLYWSDRPH